ncbi:MAG TPA: winged helix-turn-helix domain-containing protein [Bryobacteraceae bacterium]|nr:winged helix-turn-helix domain-containing protein [Bryobacteraceae bacterium]
MNPSGQKQVVLRFGIFELDLGNGELRKSGVPVKLQSQPFQLLALLAGRPGQVVGREEIRRALWGDETFVDFDQSINFCVNKLRDALEDDPQRPRCIETVPRKGYRFVAAIVEPGPGPAEAPPSHKPRWLVLAGAALVLLVIALAAKTAMPSWRVAKRIESLAVLPLENLSRDPEQEYFADGMTDDLIADLGKISALRVLSRTSVVQYKGTKKTVPEIARELSVDAVLEGTVERDRGRVRITVQLIAAAPERHLWAEKYEASLSDVLSVQDSVARAVAQAIQIKVSGQEGSLLATQRTVDPEAYEAYLKGRYFWQPGGEKNEAKSLEYFQQAIQKDPSYAPAWAGVADAYLRLASWGVLPAREAAPQVRAAAEKALTLDSNLIEPLVALVGVKTWCEWDWSGAEQLCKRAIQLSPNSGQAHSAYSMLLAATGRMQEGIAEERLARQADPLDSVFAASMSWRLYLAHRYEEAERELRKWDEWHSQRHRFGGYILASIFLQTGRTREAVEELQANAADTHHQTLLELMYLGHALGVTGAHQEGRKILAEMQALSKARYVPPDYIAMVYEGLGNRDQALKWYEKAVEQRSINLWVLPDQRLDPIRSDPRFQSLMGRMGLPR